MVLTIDAQGERYAIKMHMKNDQKAFFHMRLPAWASSSEILVNVRRRRNTAWWTAASVSSAFGTTGTKSSPCWSSPSCGHSSAYHQATYLTRGPQVLALSADGDWAYALCGNGKVTESGVTAPFAPIAWKKGNNAPVDVPVLPALMGEIRTLPLTPYADTPGAHCAFPAGG